MSLPKPEPGLVIRYAYLWRYEAHAGRDEGRKDRPCGVVVTNDDATGERHTYVLPITHTMLQMAIEIPAVVGTRLGLGAARSWIVLTEANLFAWPGPDLRFIQGSEPRRVAYGFLPPRFFKDVRSRFLDSHARGKVSIVVRS